MNICNKKFFTEIISKRAACNFWSWSRMVSIHFLFSINELQVYFMKKCLIDFNWRPPMKQTKFYRASGGTKGRHQLVLFQVVQKTDTNFYYSRWYKRQTPTSIIPGGIKGRHQLLLFQVVQKADTNFYYSRWYKRQTPTSIIPGGIKGRHQLLLFQVV